MVGEEIGFTISKEAWKLIQSGQCKLSSGGVRKHTGELVELAKPVVKKVAKGSTSKLVNAAANKFTLVSSLANNVQSAFIQKKVNVVNKKMDISLEKLEIYT